MKINLDAPKISVNRWTLALVLTPVNQKPGDSLSFYGVICTSVHNDKKMKTTLFSIIS